MSDIRLNPAVRVATAAYIEALLPLIIGPIREVARERGYAVAVHGSLSRDIDLVAIPWVEHAAEADVLVEEIKGALAGIVGRCCFCGKPSEKPHGRRAWSIHLPGLSYIDISVMPKAPAPEVADQ